MVQILRHNHNKARQNDHRQHRTIEPFSCQDILQAKNKVAGNHTAFRQPDNPGAVTGIVLCAKPDCLHGRYTAKPPEASVYIEQNQQTYNPSAKAAQQQRPGRTPAAA